MRGSTLHSGRDKHVPPKTDVTSRFLRVEFPSRANPRARLLSAGTGKVGVPPPYFRMIMVLDFGGRINLLSAVSGPATGTAVWLPGAR